MYTFVRKKAAAPADDFLKLLEEDEAFWREIDRVLPAGGVGREFFCSHLVARLLLHAKLLEEHAGDRDIMPCELFDRLLRDGWTDVTEMDGATGPCLPGSSLIRPIGKSGISSR